MENMQIKNMIKKRIGETNEMNNGLKATIIAYRGSKDIDIQFANGQIVRNKKYDHFLKGIIKCPMIYDIVGDYVKCINPNTTLTFIIDLDDLYKVKSYNCLLSISKYYAIVYNNGKSIPLHRLIMNVNDNEYVDHIDGNTLNNRKSNLRVCTQQQNTCNQKISKINTSGYKGVQYYKPLNKWRAYIGYNYKACHIGYFDTKEQAAEAYNQKAIELHGVFAKLNMV